MQTLTATSTVEVPPPALVSWNLTYRCNLACGHCYLDAVQRKRPAPGELGTPEAHGVITQLVAQAPGAMLVLTGGEPLLRSDLTELAAHAADQGLTPVIGTNGLLLNPRRARELAAAGVAGVGISIDSAEPGFHDSLRGAPNAWRCARQAVGVARAAGLLVQIQTTLFEANREALEDLADFAESAGATAFNLFFLVCTGRGVTQTDLPAQTYETMLQRITALQRRRPRLRIRACCAPYLRRMQGLHAGPAPNDLSEWSSACLAGRQYLRITPRGRVTPCPYIPMDLGDLTRQRLSEIWVSNAELNRLRNELPAGKCRICDYRLSCGGCRARAYAACGDLMAEDPKCAYIPAATTVPEVRSAPSTPVVTWTPQAELRLARIPGFLRARIRRRLEESARAQGLAQVTPEFMAAQRPNLGDS